MRRIGLVMAVLAISGVAWADAMATSVCVVEKAVFEKMVGEAGSVEKIPTGELWKSAVHHGYLSGTHRDGYAATFRVGEEAYQLLVSRQGEKVIYSISRKPEGKPAVLVCVGVVEAGKEVKSGLGDDALVVVLRSGNFLLK